MMNQNGTPKKSEGRGVGKRMMSFGYFFPTLLAVFVFSTSALADSTNAVSPVFVLDTRDASGASTAVSGFFTLNTLGTGGTNSAVSGTFTLDTRAPSGQSGYAVSNTFVLDTRGSLPVALGFQQSGASFGARVVGSLTDRTYTITNNGSTRIFGTMSVDAPFNIISGGTYNLAPGQSQTITIRFAPFASGSYTGHVTLSGGAGGSWQITASAYGDLVASNGSISGTITDAATGLPISNATVTAFINTTTIQSDTGPNTHTGGSGAQAGTYSIKNLAPNNFYHLKATAAGYYAGYYFPDPIQVAAGGSLNNINVALQPLPPKPPATVYDTPVVLVRGTGKDQDWGDGKSGDSTYFYSLRLALSAMPNAFSEIWDCNYPETGILTLSGTTGHFINGENSIQSNAYSLLSYIRQKVLQYKNHTGDYPTQINVVAHSMGGLIVRCALNDLNNKSQIEVYDPDTETNVNVTINKVVMLGTPNAGSVLADFAMGFDIGLFQPSWPATHDLTTSYMQTSFNNSYYWPQGVKLYLYAGTGGIFTTNPELLVGEAIMKRKDMLMPPEWVDDSVVTQSSVSGTYHYRSLPFFTCVSVPSFNAQLAEPLATDQSIGSGSLDHFAMLNDPTTLNWVVSRLTGVAATRSQSPSGSASPSQGTTQSNGMKRNSNSLTNQLITNQNSVLTSGSQATVSLVSDAATTFQVQLITNDTGVAFRLRDPSGTVVDSSTPGTNPNVQYTVTASGTGNMITYQITNATKGTWSAIMDGTGMVSQSAACNLMATCDSNVALMPQSDPMFGQGQDVIISCAMSDLSGSPPSPIQAATITVLVTLPDGTSTSLTLYDDGLHNDGAPNDGVYSAVMPGVQQAGEYSVTYLATGFNSLSQPLQRVASGALNISTGDGSILGDPAYTVINTSGASMADHLEVACFVQPKVSGSFILSGRLVDSTGTIRFADSESFTSDGVAATQVNLHYDLNQIRASGVSGQIHFETIQLFEVSSDATTWLDSYHGTSTFQIGPNITTAPQPQSVEEGAAAVFSVTSDSGTITYQWLFNGIAISGATGATLTLPNVALEQAGAYTVVVTNTTGSVTTTPATLSVIPAATFAAWQSAWFTNAQLNDPTISGPSADADHDGIPNLLEYVLNGNPGAASAEILPKMSKVASNFIFTFSRRAASAQDTTQIFQYSTDLSLWTNVMITSPTDAIVTLGVGDSNDVQTVTITIPAGTNASMFGRLSVSSATAPSSGFTTWIANYPNLIGSNALSTANPSQDGLTNLVKYALGLDPTVAHGAPGSLSGSTLSFTKGTMASGDSNLSYTIQESTDMANWATATRGIVSSNSGSITYTFPSSGPSNLFVRLQVTQSP